MTSLSAEELKKHRWEAKDKEGAFFVPHPYHPRGIAILDAVSLVQKKVGFTLFTGGSGRYTKYADRTNLRYCDLRELPRSDYLEWVASCKLLLQENAGEDTIRESLSLGTPVLLSTEVAKNMGIDEQKIIVNDITSADVISSRILDVLTLSTRNYMKLCERLLCFGE